MATDTNTRATPPLALRSRDAANALSISERTLWGLTAPRGPIPCVRIGACCIYPVEGLRAFLAAQSAKGGAS